MVNIYKYLSYSVYMYGAKFYDVKSKLIIIKINITPIKTNQTHHINSLNF